MRPIDRAIAAHRAGRIAEAEALYRDVLARDGRDFDALHMLGVICAQHARYDEAERLLRSALAVDERVPPCLYNYARVLSQLGRHDEAIRYYDKALVLAPNVAPIHSDRGNAQSAVGRFAEALGSYERALNLNPNFPEAHYNRGIALGKLGRRTEALASYDRAVALKPNYAAAHSNRGDALCGLGRFSDALAAYDRAVAIEPKLAPAHAGRAAALLALKRFAEALAACERAIALAPDLAAAHVNRGAALTALKRFTEAAASCDRAVALDPQSASAHATRATALLALKQLPEALRACDRAVALDAGLATAHSNRAAVLLRLQRFAEALASCDRALALDAASAPAHSNRATALLGLKRTTEAIESAGRAIALDPDLAYAHATRGSALLSLGRYDEAFAASDRALALDPDLPYVEGNRLHAKQHMCDWRDLDAETAHLLAAVRNDKPASEPFFILPVASTPADQLQCARRHAAENWPPAPAPLWRGEIYAHDRIRVAYLSSDLRDHAVAYLTAGMFEHHDRSRFEVTGISFGADQDSAMGRRIGAAFEHFVDARSASDQEIATLLRQREIDIAVDLNGFTRDGRTGIFARRPTPLALNYLGYSGTLGVDYVDYIMADSTVVPAEHFQFYSEQVVWLPDCFMSNDDRRAIAERTPPRQELQLPATGFVFCCFNQTYKFNPPTFDVWMRLLRQIDGSVLWLREGNADARRNLRAETERRGVAPDRLVFAPPVASVADHLARQRQADLFLDTLPYNAHATASDALWAGVPVLTCLGSTFAGRVAASLVKAVGLPELATASLEEYEALALALARDPARLASLRKRLADNRHATPLFDTARFTRHIEAAYTTMWRRYVNGEPPASFAVAASAR